MLLPPISPMKSAGLALFVVLLFLFVPNVASACTSFAVYSQQPIYGMNFDWSPINMYFSLTKEAEAGDNCASFSFTREDRKTGQVLAAAMKNGILLVTHQQSPKNSVTRTDDTIAEGEAFIAEIIPLALSILSTQPETGTEQLLIELAKKRFVHSRKDSGVHCLIAGPEGEAAILEVGKKANKVLTKTGDFIVMSNFAHAPFKGKDYTKVMGPGANRYIAAHEYIEENLEGFGVEQAFETLRHTAQTLTLCSLVFAPMEGNIYLALNRDFDKIWRISLTESTIETYRGFSSVTTIPIPPQGISAKTLTNIDRGNAWQTWLVSLIVGGILIALTPRFIRYWKKTRPAEERQSKEG